MNIGEQHGVAVSFDVSSVDDDVKKKSPCHRLSKEFTMDSNGSAKRDVDVEFLSIRSDIVRSTRV